ncbi:MAG: hypothetical protein EZS28_042677, partial [Streblomastix strix]
MLPENLVQPNSPQVQYQVSEIDPKEDEDSDKQIHLLQKERDMIRLRFEQKVHDIFFGDMDCPSDLNNNEIDKQNQRENSEEAKDPLSIQRDKEKHTKMDRQNQNENYAEAKILLTKEKQEENYKEIDKQSQNDDSQEFGIFQLKKKKGKHKRGKKTKIQKPWIGKSLNNMNEYQTRNLRSETRLLQSKPEVMKESKYTPNKSKVLLDNRTSHPTQLKRELLTPKSIRVGLNVDSGMLNHPILRLK